MASKPLLTQTEYDAYVDALALDARVPELLNGNIIIAARPSRLHMRYAQAVFKMSDAYVEAHQVAGEILTEFEVALDDYSMTRPLLTDHSGFGSIADLPWHLLRSKAALICFSDDYYAHLVL